MHVVVAGGAGFLGSNLIERLINEPEISRITIIDTLQSCGLAYAEEVIGQSFPDVAPATSLCIDANGKNKVITLLTKDIASGDTLSEYFSNAMAIIQLSQLSPGPFSGRTSKEIYAVNLNLTRSLLDIAVKKQCCSFIYISSFAVYGEAKTDLPINEKTWPAPVSAYGTVKLACENLCLDYSAKYGLPCTILRVANPYGKFSEHKDQLIPRIIRQVISGSDIVVNGDGNQTRDFIHAKDVAEAIYLALRNSKGSSVYNVGSGRPVKVIDVILLIQKIAGKDVRTVFLPARKNSISHSVADISKISKELGFSPTIPLEQGVLELYKRFLQHDYFR